MQLFLDALDREVEELHENKRAAAIHRRPHALSVELQARMAGERGAHGRPTRACKLQVAVSYGGRWDIVQAARRLAAAVPAARCAPEDIDEQRFARELRSADVPDPDLFIRTGGEHRISNFLLWNLAYTELYVSETLWPDFDVPQFEAALASFTGRERRFGLTREQLRTSARGGRKCLSNAC